QGPNGPTPGAYLRTFVTPASGGLLYPLGVLFGPDGNGDGRQDLYVSNTDLTGLKGKSGNVRRYDGVTGAFIDTFVTEGSGGLNDPNLMTFTQTDPVTLAYMGTKAAAPTDTLSAASTTLLTAGAGLDGGGQPVLETWGAVAGVDTIHLTGTMMMFTG